LGPSNVVIDECFTPYHEREWIGLPKEQKIAAKKLKYRRPTWDDFIPDPYDDTTWDDLTPYQKDLFEVLGYTKPIYNGYFDYDWDTLPSEVQTAVRTLSLNQESWDNCDSIYLSSCTQISWTDLSLEQQQAAGTIGLTCYDYGS